MSDVDSARPVRVDAFDHIRALSLWPATPQHLGQAAYVRGLAERRA